MSFFLSTSWRLKPARLPTIEILVLCVLSGRTTLLCHFSQAVGSYLYSMLFLKFYCGRRTICCMFKYHSATMCKLSEPSFTCRCIPRLLSASALAIKHKHSIAGCTSGYASLQQNARILQQHSVHARQGVSNLMMYIG